MQPLEKHFWWLTAPRACCFISSRGTERKKKMKSLAALFRFALASHLSVPVTPMALDVSELAPEASQELSPCLGCPPAQEGCPGSPCGSLLP